MTEQEILEGNKLLAEFMGGKDDSKRYGYQSGFFWEFISAIGISIDWDGDDSAYLSYNETRWAFEDMQFHSSWDWLMPVVNKIDDIKMFTDVKSAFFVTIRGCSCEINQDTQHYVAFSQKMDFPGIYEIADTRIESVYKSVVAFIKWYKSTISAIS